MRQDELLISEFLEYIESILCSKKARKNYRMSLKNNNHIVLPKWPKEIKSRNIFFPVSERMLLYPHYPVLLCNPTDYFW